MSRVSALRDGLDRVVAGVGAFVESASGVSPARWTPLTMLAPGRYVDRETDWTAFDLPRWSRREYRWTADDWRGYRDFVARPTECIERGAGDCEDYALVAVSWALSRGRPGVGLGFCFERPLPWPTHVVAYDDEQVYSSGELTPGTVEEWLRRSRYDHVLRRRVR
jgi:hypothetical protein